MDRIEGPRVADQIAPPEDPAESAEASAEAPASALGEDRRENASATSVPNSARYAAAANGILTPEGLRQACGHVWRDSNSTLMLGPDVLNSEPVSCDDKQALAALQRHLATRPRAFVEDVLPNLGFGPARS